MHLSKIYSPANTPGREHKNPWSKCYTLIGRVVGYASNIVTIAVTSKDSREAGCRYPAGPGFSRRVCNSPARIPTAEFGRHERSGTG